jgi:hypothetical protein
VLLVFVKCGKGQKRREEQIRALLAFVKCSKEELLAFVKCGKAEKMLM